MPEKFLQKFVDTGLEVDPNWNPEEEAHVQLQRLLPQAAIAALVKDWPGRLPESAGRTTRANDKVFAKRLAARLETYVLQWGGTKKQIEATTKLPQTKQQAAQLDWNAWYADHMPHLQAHMRRVATHADALGQQKVGNSFLNRLVNEHRVIDDVFQPTSQTANKKTTK